MSNLTDDTRDTRDPERAHGVLVALETCASAARKLETMSDAEVAAVVQEARGEVSMLSAMFDLFETIEGRLRRANGGPYRECSWCSRESVERRPGGNWACDEHRGTR